MSKPARADDSLAVLLDMQRQLNELARAASAQRKQRAARRGKQLAYSPPAALPGPEPTEVDIARAKRLWRRIR